DNIHSRNDMVGLDASILMNPKVWEASGHVSGFSDPLVECKNCHHRFKVGDVKKNCRDCGGGLTEAKQFNLMFKTNFGPVEDTASISYLRPETAQGIFVNFGNVLVASRKKLPFGIGQIGKSFRNEISPGNYIFRSREFEQMEIEYFVKPGTDEEHHKKWVEERLNWYIKYGMRKENLQLREHAKDELAHYAKACTDIEYNFPMGWSELEGIANRTDFDLKQHTKFSGKDLSYFEDDTKEHIVPYVIEPSAGVDRSLLAFMIDAYNEEMVRNEKRVVLKFHKELAPIKIAVLPLLKKRDDIVKCALEITDSLRRHFVTVYDDTASIGKLYRRQDEIGTPYCITVDVQTIEEDKNVTVRERDTMEQIRVPLAQIVQVMKEIWEEGWQKAAAKYPKQVATTSS
ncbi:glycine--tRNA ligase, partial [Candidatus Peregrinibacteria bacterium]|nr:glycine--tRNA ligase [Candidatus Peregrinibacteria bacterium]